MKLLFGGKLDFDIKQGGFWRWKARSNRKKVVCLFVYTYLFDILCEVYSIIKDILIEKKISKDGSK